MDDIKVDKRWLKGSKSSVNVSKVVRARWQKVIKVRKSSIKLCKKW